MPVPIRCPFPVPTAIAFLLLGAACAGNRPGHDSGPMLSRLYFEVYLDTSTRCADAIRLFRRNGFEDCPKYKESIGDVFLRKKFG
jgi:hypothetical protein